MCKIDAGAPARPSSCPLALIILVHVLHHAARVVVRVLTYFQPSLFHFSRHLNIAQPILSLTALWILVPCNQYMARRCSPCIPPLVIRPRPLCMLCGSFFFICFAVCCARLGRHAAFTTSVACLIIGLQSKHRSFLKQLLQLLATYILFHTFNTS